MLGLELAQLWERLVPVLVPVLVLGLVQQEQLRHRSQQRRWRGSKKNRASIGRCCFSIHRHWRCANCEFLGRRPSLLGQMHQGQWLFCSNWLSQYFPFRDQSSVAAGL